MAKTPMRAHFEPPTATAARQSEIGKVETFEGAAGVHDRTQATPSDICLMTNQVRTQIESQNQMAAKYESTVGELFNVDPRIPFEAQARRAILRFRLTPA
jgi:hypothetical protein